MQCLTNLSLNLSRVILSREHHHVKRCLHNVIVAVFTAESTECRHSTPIRLPAIHSSVGHIASLATQETGWCGSDSSPWLIEAQPGQRINITLLDFGLQSGQLRIAKTAAVRLGVSRPTVSGGLGYNPASPASYAGSATTAGSSPPPGQARVAP